MQPELSRAIPMGLLGFLLGSLAVIILRGLQGITPLWDAGVGMTLAAFTTAGFFVWGMGAFNPAMSAHGEEAEAVREKMNDENAPPRRLLFGASWQLATLVLILTVVLFAFASLPDGLTLTTTANPEASLTMAGMVNMEIGGQIVPVSQLVIFVIFIIIMFLSLAAAAAAINWMMTGMSRGITEAKLEAAGGGAAVLSAPDGEAGPAEPPTRLKQLRTAVTFIVLFVILYLLAMFSGDPMLGGLQVWIVGFIVLMLLPVAIGLGFSIWTATRKPAPPPP